MSENKKKALKTFRNPYTCAQAVYAAYADTPSEQEMMDMKHMSGGRAEGGECGALYAAKKILGKNKYKELEESFKKEAGSISCKEIKSIHKTPCEKCVSIACDQIEGCL